MLQKVVMSLIIILLFLQLAIAVELEIKPVYDKGETLITVVSGNFLDNIKPENVFFYRGHVQVPIFYDVKKIEDEYYIYALLSDTQVISNATYSLQIKNVRYYEGSQIIVDDIKRNFTISDNIADFSLNPGLILTNNDFSLKVQNLQSRKINLEVGESTILGNPDEHLKYSFDSTQNETNIISLKSGEIKNINFNIDDLSGIQLKSIILSSENTFYEVPAYLITNNSNSNIIEEDLNESNLRFNPLEMNFSTATNSKKTTNIFLYNTGQETIYDIQLSLSKELEDYIELSIYDIPELEEGSEIKIELYTNSEEESLIEGAIFADSANLSTALPIYVNFEKDYIPSEEEQNGFDTNTTTGNSSSGNNSSSEESTFSYGKIIGWGIIILLFLFLLWFYLKKYKGAHKEINLEKIARPKTLRPPRPTLP